jgi:alpha-D-ribose 1-methylphosphonate 5-triphosphate synthase subunit PhnH
MIETGFSNPPVDSASAFRTILQALSRPGLILPFSPPASPPPPLLAGTAAVALTLCDFQTPIWLAPALNADPVAQFLRFQTGAPIISDLETAAFAFQPVAENMAMPSQFAQGTHESPDRSATLVLQVDDMKQDGPVTLTGPGILQPLRFGVERLGISFWQAMTENHAGFPMGIDVIFISRTSIAALPRSTSIAIVDAY